VEIPRSNRFAINCHLPAIVLHVLEQHVLQNSTVSDVQKEKPGDSELTLATIEAWIHPLMGGMSDCNCPKTLFMTSMLVTSHAGASTRTPWLRRSSTTLRPSSVLGPDRESSTKFLAPRSAIHLAVARPIPPKPPAMTKVAWGSNWKLGRVGNVT
jgi:hypothetical protein